MTNSIEPTFFSPKFSLDEVFNFKRAACTRYYDPGVGRFLQKDPDPGKLRNPASVVNGYVYVQNRPTMWIDPSGRFPWLIIAIISLATTAYENHFKGGNFLEQFAKNFAVNSLIYLIGVGLGGAEFSATATWQRVLGLPRSHWPLQVPFGLRRGRHRIAELQVMELFMRYRFYMESAIIINQAN